MPAYSFLNLSPAEFEELTRDLLQKELGIHLESFGAGKDGGTDLRCAYSKDSVLIVQCKRYADYSNLLQNLKKEVLKVQKLKPKRYIICTSVNLLPGNKKVIYTLFKDFILSEADIFGKEDLNNLLGKYPEVERAHFKLWLSSSNIMERILKSKVYNQTNFEEEKIKEAVKIYVYNQSYTEALELLEKYRYVIISGTPGIGKSTLARILSYHFLANGFEDFIFLSESIDDGYSMYNEERKQIFLFDDFLGKSFLDKKLKNNEEERIVRFIERIGKSDNKLLILTTREYILSQARNQYEALDKKSIHLAKCIIDLEQYTKLVRAKILYNHLYFAELQQPFIDKILEDKNYNRIINHKNYNPRIIETVLRNISEMEETTFINDFIGYLDYPESIWRHVYESQISKFSQLVLANMFTAGTPITMVDLERIMKSFTEKKGNKYDVFFNQIDFKKAIKELEHTFIITSKNNKSGIIVDYLNPSVQDFLISYLGEISDMLVDIIHSAIFLNQLLDYFDPPTKLVKGKHKIKSRIIVDDKLSKAISSRIISNFVHLENSRLYKQGIFSSNAFYWHKEKWSTYRKLNAIADSNLMNHIPALKNFVLEVFQMMIIPEHILGGQIGDYTSLVARFFHDLDFEEVEIMEILGAAIENMDDYNDFKTLEVFFESHYKDFIDTNSTYREAVMEMIKFERDNIDTSDIPEFINELKVIGEHTGIDVDDLCAELDEKYDQRFDHYDYDDEDRRPAPQTRANERDIDSAISDMFDSLK